MVAAFLEQGRVEVHGPSLTSFQEQAAVLSKSLGYPIRINTVPAGAWAQALMGFGLTKLFAYSFLHTVQMADGAIPPERPIRTQSSALLLATGWHAKYDVHTWAVSAHVQAAFRK